MWWMLLKQWIPDGFKKKITACNASWRSRVIMPNPQLSAALGSIFGRRGARQRGSLGRRRENFKTPQSLPEHQADLHARLNYTPSLGAERQQGWHRGSENAGKNGKRQRQHFKDDWCSDGRRGKEKNAAGSRVKYHLALEQVIAKSMMELQVLTSYSNLGKSD